MQCVVGQATVAPSEMLGLTTDLAHLALYAGKQAILHVIVGIILKQIIHTEVEVDFRAAVAMVAGALKRHIGAVTCTTLNHTMMMSWKRVRLQTHATWNNTTQKTETRGSNPEINNCK